MSHCARLPYTQRILNARSLLSSLSPFLLALVTACGGSGSGNDGGTSLDAHLNDTSTSSDATPSDGHPNADGSTRDVSNDGTLHRDATMDAVPDAVVCGCGPTEICGDGYDNNCDGRVDEACGCLPGTTQRCQTGTPDPNAPICALGQQSCEGSGEFGLWGDCTGAGNMADAASTAIACRRILILGAPGANPSSNFQSWLEQNGAIVTRAQTTASDGVLRRELLDTFDLVVIDWLQRDYATAEADTLRDWVVAGGALVSMSGHDSGATADRQVSLLASIGMTYVLGTAYNGPATFISPSPLSNGVDVPVTFNGGLEVTTTSAFTGTSTIVATVPTNVTAGMIGTLGSGRLFVFGDEWIEFDSEWSTMPAIPQLWFNSVNYVNPNPGHAPMLNCE